MSKVKAKLRSRRSRLSIASGLSTPFDVDDMEELVSDSEFDQEKEEQEDDQPGPSNVRVTNYDNEEQEEIESEPSLTRIGLIRQMLQQDGSFLFGAIVIAISSVLLLQLIILVSYCSFNDSFLCRLLD